MNRVTLVLAALLLLGTLSTSATAAQDASGATGITAIGYGHASAPAASADLQFVIMFNYLYGPAGAAGAEGPLPAPPEATPGAQTRAFLEPIAEVVRQIEGVERVEITVPFAPPFQKDPNILGRLDITFASPTRERLTGLYIAVSEAAFDHRLLLGNVGASFTAADCAALEREARQAAIDDARGRAGLQAELIDAELGDILASEDLPISTGPALPSEYGIVRGPGPCDPATSPPASSVDYYSGITLPPFNPSVHTGQVDVYRQVRVTFAIDTGGSLM